MLKKIAVALLATAMVAGAAFAAQPSATAGSTPPAAAGVANAATAAMPAHPIKHMRKHARGKIHSAKTVHHFKSGKSHKSHVSRINKSTKVVAKLAARLTRTN